MTMGFGCNAAGVVATRIIDSPRERLIAIITNNFALCNGRWPTQILIATIFIGALAPAHLAGPGLGAGGGGVAVLGVVLTFAASWLLSRTVLRGEVSTFSLELPPYRPPRVLADALHLADRPHALRAVARGGVRAAGRRGHLAGGQHPVGRCQPGGARSSPGSSPFGLLIGLNGVILLAYIVAIPANEIVIPTILMLTVLMTGSPDVGAGAGVMFELDSATDTAALLRGGGWTLLTAVNLMLFSLLHNPCSTTIYTIYKETGSVKWTTLAALLPLGLGFLLCFIVAQSMTGALGRALDGRECLLVLDGLDLDATAAGPVLQSVLEATTDARVVVTALTTAGEPDESVVRVGPLPVPAHARAAGGSGRRAVPAPHPRRRRTAGRPGRAGARGTPPAARHRWAAAADRAGGRAVGARRAQQRDVRRQPRPGRRLAARPARRVERHCPAPHRAARLPRRPRACSRTCSTGPSPRPPSSPATSCAAACSRSTRAATSTCSRPSAAGRAPSPAPTTSPPSGRACSPGPRPTPPPTTTTAPPTPSGSATSRPCATRS